MSRRDVREEEAPAINVARFWIEALESCRLGDTEDDGEARGVETVGDMRGVMVARGQEW